MLSFVLLFAVFSTAYGGTAGLFQLPFNPLQSWSACGSTGYWPLNNGVTSLSSQYYMELNTEFSMPMYHLGEDWNGKCGSDTDIGGDLRAIAERMGVPYTIIFGQKEALDNTVIVRNMETRSQETVTLANLPDFVKHLKEELK